MKQVSGIASHRSCSATIFAMSAGLFCLGVLWSSQVLAVGQPSTYPGCAKRAVTVPWGGSVKVNLASCHSFGLGVVSTAPKRGTVTLGDTAPIDSYKYKHNGASPTGNTDTFVVLDDNSDFITVTVTIQARRAK